MMTIRKARPEDFEKISAFYQAFNYTPVISPAEIFVVAEREGQFCGVVRICEEQGVLLLRGMRVLPGLRRQGIGARMLEKVAPLVGQRTCFCIPHRHLSAFYSRIGFVEAEESEVPAFLRDRLTTYRSDYGLDVIVMCRPAQTGSVHERLLAAARRRTAPPPARAAAGDELAALGWAPDDLPSFVEIPVDAPGSPGYAFRIGRYPVTNAQYARFLQPASFADPALWSGCSQYDFDCEKMHHGWGEVGWRWLEAKKKHRERWSVEEGILYPLDWQYERYGIARPAAPVVGLSWYEAGAYCRWLLAHWSALAEATANPGYTPQNARLPLETEWVAAAGGAEPVGRCPWDAGEQVSPDEEVRLRANVCRVIDRTTPVWLYPEGASPWGVWDLGGNVLEWQANFGDEERDVLALRGGSWSHDEKSVRLSPAARSSASPDHNWNTIGFRVCLPPGVET